MNIIADRALSVSPSLTLEITAKGKKMKEDGIDVVSFGAGEPDFNTPDYINDKAKEAIDRGFTKYTPASGTVELRKAVCDKLQRDNNLSYDFTDIVISNGGKHALYNALMATVNPGDEVILPAPYWLTYPELIKLCGGVVKILETKPENDFKMTPEQLTKAITKKTKAIIFNNPSNPTGTVYGESEIRALAAVLEKADIYVISDEIYEKLCYGVEFFSIAQVSEKMKNNTIVVNGLSKTYSMTGWRIGYTASNKTLAKAMGNIQSHTASNPNSIAQYASVAAIEDKHGETFLKEMNRTFDRRRNLAISMLKEMQPLTYVEPKGAFYIMVGIAAVKGKSVYGKIIKTAADFANALIDAVNVVAIPCESFGAPDYIRLSYAISDENIKKGLERIKKFTDMLE